MMRERQKVTIERDLGAVMIPSGERTLLRAGTDALLMQALGGTFTLSTYEGYLYRIDGKDADAVLGEDGKPAIGGAGEAGAPLADSAPTTVQEVEDRVWSELKTCFDPEIPVNIVDLGLIYRCEVQPVSDQGFKVQIQMTLTAPGCGMGPVIQSDAESKIRAIPGVVETDIQLTFDPPWDRERMSDAARLQLGFM